LERIETLLAKPLGSAAVEALEAARGAFAGVFGALSIGIGIGLAAKENSASGIANAGFSAFAGAVAGVGARFLRDGDQRRRHADSPLRWRMAQRSD